MKKLIGSLIVTVALAFTAFGQAPEGFKYQAVLRDATNLILTNQTVGVRLTIQQGNIGGTAVYTETFAATTNAYGLVNLEIGTGTTSDDFSAIDWASGSYFMETAVDIAGGANYSVMGTSQLMSVPYALYAKTAGSSTPGPQGPAGNNGLDGATGPMGPQGPTGLNGADGNDGLDGATGPMGPQGPAGTNGLNGATGPMGPQGPAGLNGAAGNDGLDGATGPMGPQGPQGPQGIQGPAGGTSPTYTIGLWPELGGYVFWVSADGMHGLVLETQEQGYSNWYDAPDLISNPNNHSPDGQKFRDWRLPTKYELSELQLQQMTLPNLNTTDYHWSSSEYNSNDAWYHQFGYGSNPYGKTNPFVIVRSVRSF